MRTIRIGLLGLGTVGQAVVQLQQDFDNHRFRIERALVRDAKKPRTVSIPLTSDPRDIVEDPAIDIVVEVAGGREDARAWILEALSRGKAVVTANKEVMAYHGAEILQASRTRGVYLGYEASVGGGIPILESLKLHLSSAPVKKVYGVLNGTTNYLLCSMEKGKPLVDALRQAQDKGFAEADPSADLKGLDTARKLVLLAHLAFKSWINPDELVVKGLEDWPPSWFSRLQHSGLTLRLLAIARQLDNSAVEASVRPTIVARTHPLGWLQDAENGIGVMSAAGHFWMQGPGAGGLATATSIWADIRRSQLFANIGESPTMSLTVVQEATQPLVGIALDPDRQLAPAGRFNDPSLVYQSSSAPRLEGVVYFPFWE